MICSKVEFEHSVRYKHFYLEQCLVRNKGTERFLYLFKLPFHGKSTLYLSSMVAPWSKSDPVGHESGW